MKHPGTKTAEIEVAFFVIILSGVYIAYEIVAEPSGGHPTGTEDEVERLEIRD